MLPDASSANPVPVTSNPIVSPPPTIPPSVTVIPSEKPVSPTPTPTPKPKLHLKFLIPLFFIFFLLVPALSVSAYFVATDKINLRNPGLQQSITNAVFSIPLIPKTPKIILNSAISAHEKLTKNSFDLSLAATSDDLKSVVGASNTDVRLTGYIDYADPKNPRLSLTADLGKELSGKVIKNDAQVYFKIDRFPAAILAFLGTNPEVSSLITENWISYDSTPLDTQARQALDTTSPKSQINETNLKIMREALDADILPLFKQTTETLDGTSAYKLTFAPTGNQLDAIFAKLKTKLKDETDVPKPSSYVKNFELSLWISQKDHYLLKGALNLTVDPTEINKSRSLSSAAYSSMTSSVAQLALVLTMSDFGKDLPITSPSTSITFDELTKRIFSLQVQATPSANSMYEFNTPPPSTTP